MLSNTFCCLLDGNVSLSVTMTRVSTIATLGSCSCLVVVEVVVVVIVLSKFWMHAAVWCWCYQSSGCVKTVWW